MLVHFEKSIVRMILWISQVQYSGCQIQNDKFAEQVEVTRRLFQALRNSDTTAIRNMLYNGFDDRNDFTFQSMASIQYLKKVILNCNITGSEGLSFNEYPPEAPQHVDIIIKPCDLYFSEGNIVVSFAKYSDTSLIFSFKFQRNSPIKSEDFAPLK